jgi:hypothetical protein
MKCVKRVIEVFRIQKLFLWVKTAVGQNYCCGPKLFFFCLTADEGQSFSFGKKRYCGSKILL